MKKMVIGFIASASLEKKSFYLPQVILLGILIALSSDLFGQATCPYNTEIIVRTPGNISTTTEANNLVSYCKTNGIDIISISFKQDEDDEYPSGSAFYPSTIAPVASSAYSSDPLLYLINQAHANGIKIKAWIPQFHDQVAFNKNTAWRMMKKNPDGTIVPFTGSAGTEYFVNPIHPDVQQYELSIVKEIVTKYNVDAVVLDWLRFDDYNMDLSTYTRTLYQNERGYDPATIDFTVASVRRDEWNSWRTDKIGFYVQQVQQSIDAIKSGLPLGVYILAPEWSEVGQDAAKFKNYIDFVSPMAYFDDWGYPRSWTYDNTGIVKQTIDKVADESKVLPAWDTDWTTADYRDIMTNVKSRYPLINTISFFLYGRWTNAYCSMVNDVSRMALINCTGTGQSPYTGAAIPIPGKIEAENYDLGGEGIAYHDVTTGNSGGVFRNDGVDIEGTTDTGGGYNIGYTATGEWLEYAVNVTAGTYRIDLRVAAAGAGSSLHIELDGVNISGTVSVPNTGGWQAWRTLSVNNVSLAAGQKILRIVVDAGGFNLNNVSFATLSNQTPYGGIAGAIPGKIEAERYDVGGEGIAYHDLTAGNSGGVFRSDGVDIEATTDTGGGYNIGYISTGEWLEYTVNAQAGTYRLEARVASTVASGRLHVELNGVTIATLNVPNTGGWQNWQTVSINTPSVSAGQQIMRIYFDAGNCNLNHVNFVTVTALTSSSLQRERTYVAPENGALSLTANSYPNPAEGNSTITVQIPEGGNTLVRIYGSKGDVTELQNGYLPAGAHDFHFSTSTLTKGIYVYTIIHNGKKITKKLVIK